MFIEKVKLQFLARPRFYILLFFMILAIVGFEEVADDVFLDPSEGDFEAQQLDSSISNLARSFRAEHLNQVMTDLTSLGSVSVLTTLFLILATVVYFYRDYVGLGYLALIFVGSGVWPSLLKLYFKRERPLLEDHLVRVLDYSFPSGHSFGAAAIYIGLSFYVARFAHSRAQELTYYFLGLLLISIVGVSRIYLGVHFATDVLAGICGGAVWGLFLSLIYERHLSRRSKARDATP